MLLEMGLKIITIKGTIHNYLVKELLKRTLRASFIDNKRKKLYVFEKQVEVINAGIVSVAEAIKEANYIAEKGLLIAERGVLIAKKVQKYY